MQVSGDRRFATETKSKTEEVEEYDFTDNKVTGKHYDLIKLPMYKQFLRHFGFRAGCKLNKKVCVSCLIISKKLQMFNIIKLCYLFVF